MRPKFFPSLVNDRFGDPAVYIDFLQERRAILFDLGDIHALPTRQILRLTDVFVTHTHIDHFFGFDQLLRVLVGRDKQLRLYGPAGFIDRVEAKLAAYTWDLVHRFQTELTFIATEIGDRHQAHRAQFRFSHRFAREEMASGQIDSGVLLDEPALKVTCVQLDHHKTACLAFALQESAHINIWKNKLEELHLAVGPWLAQLKAAIHENRPDDTPITVQRTAGAEDELSLGFLRNEIVSITPGQKLAYVTDTAFTPANEAAILDLARDSNTLFIEAAFAKADAALAADRAHLTTAQAGTLARKARAERVVPFHFSPRYEHDETMLLDEVVEAFRGD